MQYLSVIWRQAARYYILQHAKPHHPTPFQTLTNHNLVRPILAKFLRKKVAQKARPEHYPAPFAVIDNWVQVGVNDIQRALKVEAESVGKMAVTDTAHNLLRVFFLQERLKSLVKVKSFMPHMCT